MRSLSSDETAFLVAERQRERKLEFASISKSSHLPTVKDNKSHHSSMPFPHPTRRDSALWQRLYWHAEHNTHTSSSILSNSTNHLHQTHTPTPPVSKSAYLPAVLVTSGAGWLALMEIKNAFLWNMRRNDVIEAEDRGRLRMWVGRTRSLRYRC